MTAPSSPEDARPESRGDLTPRFADHLTGYALPLGLFALLTGMIWSGDRGHYHQFFYWLLALPSFVLAASKRDVLAHLARSPIFLAFAAFGAYLSLSIAWSGTEDGVGSLLKRPLYVLLLFIAVVELGRCRPDRLSLVVRAAALFAVAAGAISLLLFGLAGPDGPDGRLSGFGALRNPLLTSHVFGFFLALWIAFWMSERRLFSPLSIVAVVVLGALILATGSRTPLVALAATVLWLAALSGDRRGLLACAALLGIGTLVAIAWPEAFAQRGLSYRPQIWAEALRQIAEHPLIGHGYEHPLRIHIDGIDYPFWDPHNMSLSVLYQGGLIGLGLWLALYLTALITSWRRRSNLAVFICSAPLVYGLVAGMTEGGSFLSRPKEHWFLIWIPLALLAAAIHGDDEDGQTA